MAVKYTKIPTTDSYDSNLTFDYSSPFSYDEGDSSYKYRSAFKYTTNQDRKHIYSDLDVQTSQSSVATNVIHGLLSFIFIILLILTFPVSIWFTFKMIPNFQKIVIFRLGKLIGAKGPGIVCVIPFIDRLHKVDVRIKAFNVPPKQIITRDGAVVEVGSDVHYRIADVVKSITCVQNLDQSTRILVQTALLKILVKHNLAEIETQRNALGRAVQESSTEASKEWGVEICRIELSQVKVIRGPPPKQTPSVMFPPGMMSATGSSTKLPPALQNIASALLNTAQGRGSIGEGMSPTGESDATLMMSIDDLQAMFKGEVKPFQAYMSGRLQAAGDLDAAMRLEEVIKKITGR
ncbi:hypothetical protein LOTGIDRAFT_183359 [Lottia gigantea]|uniref:Band 7 domain-containing protein n=1 Tax=Lottia gigantea TaxID=225164 RepID=V4A7P2_LOTGI|nr:hypothetical protein LOTGIDRAFT_183359 [Lottia gigantea]ESO89311.1 hypothetical protein LOTGIDRAFT_183359 [Lottia gigantea]